MVDHPGILSNIVADAVDDVLDVVHPIPVHIVGSDLPDRIEGSDYTSFQTKIVTGAPGEQMIQLIAQDIRRKRAVIQINPGPTAANILGYILIGTQAEIPQRQGYTMYNGNSLTIETGRAIWLIGDGASHEFTVSVVDERYQPRPVK